MTRPAIYLDHNAAAPLLPEARTALIAALDLVGNPSSVHGHGRALRNLIDTARGQVAQLAGRRAQAGGVHRLGHRSHHPGNRRRRQGASASSAIVVSAGEHTAALKAAEATGLPVTHHRSRCRWRHRSRSIGRGDWRAADAADETLLVALHWVNNETGVVQPMGRINALVGPTPAHSVHRCGAGFRQAAPRFCRLGTRYDGGERPQDRRSGRHRRAAGQGPCRYRAAYSRRRAGAGTARRHRSGRR